MTWIERLLSKDPPDIEAIELLKALATTYERPPAAVDSNGILVQGIGARDKQIRILHQEIDELKLVLSSLILLLAHSHALKTTNLAQTLEQLRTRIEHWELGGLEEKNPDEQ
jgi:hypothetical protein